MDCHLPIQPADLLPMWYIGSETTGYSACLILVLFLVPVAIFLHLTSNILGFEKQRLMLQPTFVCPSSLAKRVQCMGPEAYIDLNLQTM